jgi:FAD-dependent urate hydroxylase
MRVIVAGGGVAGLTVAGLLSRTGEHHVTVLEQAPSYGDIGYGIGLYPLGGAVFHALGRSRELLERSTVLDTYEVYGPDGSLLQSVAFGDALKRFGPMLGVSRADLIEILASCVPEGAIRFGTHAVAVKADGEGVCVTTADASSFEGDVVIAADGMNSAVRRSLFGDVPLDETGFDAWMWWADPGGVGAHTAAEHWGPKAFVGLYPMPRGVNVAVGVPKNLSPEPSAEPDEILSSLRAIVAEHNPGAADLPGIWKISAGKPFLWPLADVRAPEITALGGRVALVGDSGIGFLPTAGVGASNALRSAAALAYELSLADAQGVPEALARWQHRVKKLVEANQRDSREIGKLMLVKHASTSAVVDTILKHTPMTSMLKSIVKSMEVSF